MRDFDKALADLFRPFIAAAIIIAYFLSPSLKLFDPIHLMLGGTCLGIGVYTVNFAIVEDDASKFSRTLLTGVVITLAGVMGLLVASIYAQQLASRLDRQCRLLQLDMLRVKPARSDSRELFVTLGCRVQDTGVLKMPSNRGWKQEGEYIYQTAK